MSFHRQIGQDRISGVGSKEFVQAIVIAIDDGLKQSSGGMIGQTVSFVTGRMKGMVTLTVDASHLEMMYDV